MRARSEKPAPAKYTGVRRCGAAGLGDAGDVGIGTNIAVVEPVVVIVSVVVAVVELGVTVVGLKEHAESAGRPVQEKLTGAVKLP